jgi:hypothetical protein
MHFFPHHHTTTQHEAMDMISLLSLPFFCSGLARTPRLIIARRWGFAIAIISMDMITIIIIGRLTVLFEESAFAASEMGRWGGAEVA